MDENEDKIERGREVVSWDAAAGGGGGAAAAGCGRWWEEGDIEKRLLALERLVLGSCWSSGRRPGRAGWRAKSCSCCSRWWCWSGGIMEAGEVSIPPPLPPCCPGPSLSIPYPPLPPPLPPPPPASSSSLFSSSFPVLSFEPFLLFLPSFLPSSCDDEYEPSPSSSSAFASGKLRGRFRRRAALSKARAASTSLWK